MIYQLRADHLCWITYTKCHLPLKYDQDWNHSIQKPFSLLTNIMHTTNFKHIGYQQCHQTFYDLSEMTPVRPSFKRHMLVVDYFYITTNFYIYLPLLYIKKNKYSNPGKQNNFPEMVMTCNLLLSNSFWHCV